METLTIKKEKITIWHDNVFNVPIIYLHVYNGNGENIWRICKQLNCPTFILVTISNLNWDDDMSPWAIPPISINDNPCQGLACQQLKLLKEEIIPAVENTLICKPTLAIIGGYSLAGLFALWSLYNTDYFSAAICCSGSFWFPKFTDYGQTHEFKRIPECIYFSLGDKEKDTTNKYLKTVEDKTKTIYEEIQKQNIKTIFEMNPGNHFQDPDLRMAKGIWWVLNNLVIGKE